MTTADPVPGLTPLLIRRSDKVLRAIPAFRMLRVDAVAVGAALDDERNRGRAASFGFDPHAYARFGRGGEGTPDQQQGQEDGATVGQNAGHALNHRSIQRSP